MRMSKRFGRSPSPKIPARETEIVQFQWPNNVCIIFLASKQSHMVHLLYHLEICVMEKSTAMFVDHECIYPLAGQWIHALGQRTDVMGSVM